MAKIKLGALVGSIGGSIGGTTYSHNRYGYYARDRVKPVMVQTIHTQRVRQLMAMISSAWKGLLDAERAAWNTWAQTNPIVDKLGDRQVLAGNAAFVRLGTVLFACGSTMPTLPPVKPAPTGILSLSATWDIGVGDFEITFTPDPTGVGMCLYVWAAVVDGASRTYVKNLYKLVQYNSANDPSPIDLQAAIEARFGSLIVGQRISLSVALADNTTGLVSVPRLVSGTVVSTP